MPNWDWVIQQDKEDEERRRNLGGVKAGDSSLIPQGPSGPPGVAETAGNMAVSRGMTKGADALEKKIPDVWEYTKNIINPERTINGLDSVPAMSSNAIPVMGEAATTEALGAASTDALAAYAAPALAEGAVASTAAPLAAAGAEAAGLATAGASGAGLAAAGAGAAGLAAMGPVVLGLLLAKQLKLF